MRQILQRNVIILMEVTLKDNISNNKPRRKRFVLPRAKRGERVHTYKP